MSGSERGVCLLGVAAAILVFSVARWGVPFAQSNPYLRPFVASPCLLRKVVGVPCPFCGGTRAAVLAAHGEWVRSLAMNPLGFLVIVGGAFAAVWLAICAATGRDLGLAATRRMLSRIPWRWVLPAGLTSLWAYEAARELLLRPY